jgi:hypothetical protein
LKFESLRRETDEAGVDGSGPSGGEGCVVAALSYAARFFFLAGV